MTKTTVHREILPNGLTVLLRPHAVAPVAEVQIWARVGSADERPGEEGLAHFFEHMLFKGTARRGVGDVAGEIEGAGGRINAYTSYDVTVYHATVPSSATALGVDVLADAVRHSVFDPAEIEREVEVVLEEIRRGEDSPGQVLGNAVFAEVFRAHPYRFPILGTPASVSTFSRERVLAFHRRWYTPDNLMVIVVAISRRRCSRRFARRSRARSPWTARAHARRGRGCECRAVRPFERASFELACPRRTRARRAPLLDLTAFIR